MLSEAEELSVGYLKEALIGIQRVAAQGYKGSRKEFNDFAQQLIDAKEELVELHGYTSKDIDRIINCCSN